MAAISAGFHISFRTDQGTEVIKTGEFGKGSTKLVGLGKTATGLFCAIVQRINLSEKAAERMAHEYRVLKLFTGVEYVAQLFCTLTNTPDGEDDRIGRDGYFLEHYQNNLWDATLATTDAFYSFPTELLKKMAIDACKGLQFFHAAGWAHRDIKPQNIFCQNKDGVWRGVLGDFDRAQDLSKKALLSLPLYGTLSFSSPQVCQILKGQSLPENELGLKEADTWAMGIVLFFVIYRELPKWTTPQKDLTNTIAALTNRAIQRRAEPRIVSSETDQFVLTLYLFLELLASERPSIDVGLYLLTTENAYLV